MLVDNKHQHSQVIEKNNEEKKKTCKFTKHVSLFVQIIFVFH